MSHREEMDTYEGQVYHDEMMECELTVTKIDDECVWVRRNDVMDEARYGNGNPYRWRMWAMNKDSGRFQLQDDISAAEKRECETAADTDDAEDDKLGPEEFEQQDALSW